MLNRIDSSEITDWMMYDMVQPFGPERDDYRIASFAAFYGNTKQKKGGKRIKAQDFMPFTKKVKQSKKDIISSMKGTLK